MNAARRDAFHGCCCAGIVLFAIALTWPFVESGVNDDWSYTKTALDLAQTGHLRYNGWAAAMVGAQAYWGALFIKLFGFSFFITRLSTAPLAAGCATLLYFLHRRAQLSPELSVFAALTLTLSPVFIPHAASFMTEVPGLFLFLLSMFAYTRALELFEARDDESRRQPARRSFYGWIVGATIAGLLAGSVRQAFWLMPVLAPVYFVIRSPGRLTSWKDTFGLVLLSLGSLAIAVEVGRWFYDQPFAIHERLGDAFHILRHGKTARLILKPIRNCWLMIAAMTLPALITLAFACRPIFTRRRWSIAFATTCIVLAAVATVQKAVFDPPWIFPWLPNTFTMTPYLTGTTPIPPTGIRATLSWPFWKTFSVVVMFLAFTGAAAGLLVWVWPPRVKLRLLEFARRSSAPVALFSLFAAGYVPLLFLKSLVPGGAGLFDRYLLPLVPLVTLLGLRTYSASKGKTRAPLLGWASLILLAYYGVAQTHDYFTLLRARLKLTTALQNHGIPRTKIMGGFEFDSWTQISEAGYYNDPRIENPKLQYVAPSPLPFQTQYIFWQCTPVVHPLYIICLAEHPELTAVDLAPALYRAWVPPFSRRCLVQTTDPSLASLP